MPNWYTNEKARSAKKLAEAPQLPPGFNAAFKCLGFVFSINMNVAPEEPPSAEESDTKAPEASSAQQLAAQQSDQIAA